MRAVWIVLAANVLAGCAGPPTMVRALAIPPTGPRYEATVTELLARPLHTLRIPPGEACPVDDERPLGASPLYPSQRRLRIEERTFEDGLYHLKNVWFSSGGRPGAIVVRVARLDGEGRGFVRLNYNGALSRGYALVFPLPDTDEDWPSGTVVSGPGCYAYQLDGADFTMVIVFSVEE